MSIDYDELLSPHAEYWLEVDEDGRIYYFTLFDTISEHVFRISANSKSTKTGLDFPRAVFPNRTICNLAEVPDVYKTLFEKIYLVTGMAGHLKAPSTPLCYTGLELTRDSFELYVRLIYHLEYLAHCIAAYQWGLDVGYDPFPTQLEQVSPRARGLGLVPKGNGFHQAYLIYFSGIPQKLRLETIRFSFGVRGFLGSMLGFDQNDRTTRIFSFVVSNHMFSLI